MLRDSYPIGAITVWRAEVGPFTDRQIALLRTFADSTRRRASVTRLMWPCSVSTAMFSGEAAAVGPFGEAMIRRVGRIEALEFPLTRETVSGRSVVERRTLHVHDLAAEREDEFPIGRELQRRFGHRTLLATPLLREGVPVGVLILFRTEVDPFSDKQLQLSQIFADQAVIAIENVRLFTELEARNRDLSESLEQQTATSEILRVISSSPTDLQPVFDIIAESAVKLCGAEVGLVTRLEGEWVDAKAVYGTNDAGREAIRRVYPMRPSAAATGARAIRDRAIAHIPDVLAEEGYGVQEAALASGFRSALGVPMMREGRAIGSIAIGRAAAGEFSERQIKLLCTFADQAVIAIENVRLFTELQTRNGEITEALEQQTATSEILQVISSSPTDLQPVFDIIAESAVKLCGAEVGLVTRFDGEWVEVKAMYGSSSAGTDALRRAFPMRPSGAGAAARAIRDRAIAHIPDVLADREYDIQEAAVAGGFRAVLAVPMLREGRAIGSVGIGRSEAGEFSERQINLLQTFADQAMIAIENVRLFKELESRNSDLTEALEQQTATSEILRVISSSPTDVQPVFDTIVRSAVMLCDSLYANVFRFDGELLHFVASNNHAPEVLTLDRGRVSDTARRITSVWPGHSEQIDCSPARCARRP